MVSRVWPDSRRIDELAVVAGMRESVTRHVCARSGKQGWSDTDLVLTPALLNLAGGECVDDVEKLARDAGSSEVMERVRWAGLPPRERLLPAPTAGDSRRLGYSTLSLRRIWATR